jgi:hypothetical protein
VARYFYPDKIDKTSAAAKRRFLIGAEHAPRQTLEFEVMEKSRRREAVRAYKETKPQSGVYAVRCGASGEVWVGGSPNLQAQHNRVLFALKGSGHPNPAMQAAWRGHGEDSISFEVLERIEDEDLSPMGRADLIKARERHWLEALGAKKAAG